MQALKSAAHWGDATQVMDLSLDVVGVAAVAVFGPNLSIGAVNYQLAAITGCLRARYSNGLGLGWLDDRSALRAGRDDGKAVGAGGDVDVLTHINCQFEGFTALGGRAHRA